MPKKVIVSTASDGGHIHQNIGTITLMPTIHFEEQSASSLLKPTFSAFFINMLLAFLAFISPFNRQHQTLILSSIHDCTMIHCSAYLTDP